MSQEFNLLANKQKKPSHGSSYLIPIWLSLNHKEAEACSHQSGKILCPSRWQDYSLDRSKSLKTLGQKQNILAHKMLGPLARL